MSVKKSQLLDVLEKDTAVFVIFVCIAVAVSATAFDLISLFW